jgi:hypothetical protein
VVILWNLKTDSEFTEQTGTFGPLGLVSFVPEREIVFLAEFISRDILKTRFNALCIKSCSRVLHSFRQGFSSRFKVHEKLEFARTAEFSPVFDSDFLLFTTARAMNYLSNDSLDSELSFI